jgi:hypothetical protein
VAPSPPSCPAAQGWSGGNPGLGDRVETLGVSLDSQPTDGVFNGCKVGSRRDPTWVSPNEESPVKARIGCDFYEAYWTGGASGISVPKLIVPRFHFEINNLSVILIRSGVTKTDHQPYHVRHQISTAPTAVPEAPLPSLLCWTGTRSTSTVPQQTHRFCPVRTLRQGPTVTNLCPPSATAH